MRKITEFLRRNWKRIQILSFFLITSLLVVIMFPIGGKFKYEFQKGKPWMHEDLIAPFNFPIYKSDAELAAERDSIMEVFAPYFRMDTSIVNQNYARFEENATDLAGLEEEPEIDEKIKTRLKELILEKLQYTYQKGIVQSAEVLTSSENPGKTVMLMRGPMAEERTYSELFTQRTAYEYLKRNVEEEFSDQPGQVQSKIRNILRNLDLNEYIQPNLFYDQETSARVREELISEISLAKGMVQSGERIISRGELVDQKKYRILESFRREYSGNVNYSGKPGLIFLGRLILVLTGVTMLYLFMLNFRKEIIEDRSKTIFIMLLLLLVTFIASMTLKYQAISIYVVPFVIVPIMISTFFDSRLALFIHTIIILLVGFWVPNGFEFVFLNIIAGIVAIFSLSNSYRRGILFATAVLISVTYIVVYFGINIIQERSLSLIDYPSFIWFAGNGLLILTAYPLIFIFEKTFNFLSDATLFELSDTNQPLLRKLSETAPGTFQHSMQVGNLAEEAMIQISGNPLLIRTAALYHDIGKMENSGYFIENLLADQNPHDQLSFEESAEIIISHVEKGVKIARKHNLPEQIIDFIRTHHGTTMVQYFYKRFLRTHSEQETDLSRFTYPGPKPFTREMAVLMMADAVEAASRSLNEKTAASLNSLVDQIIDEQMRQNQFENAAITLKDIHTIREIFKKKLLNIYHARIEYPE